VGEIISESVGGIIPERWATSAGIGNRDSTCIETGLQTGGPQVMTKIAAETSLDEVARRASRLFQPMAHRLAWRRLLLGRMVPALRVGHGGWPAPCSNGAKSSVTVPVQPTNASPDLVVVGSLLR
jgi:hypothetical protein